MIRVIDAQNRIVGNFDNDNDLISFITSKNHLWGYVERSCSDLERSTKLKKMEYITASEYKALKGGYSIIEIKRGANRPLNQVVLVPDVDADSLLSGFYQTVCTDWGWSIRKTIYAASFAITRRGASGPSTVALQRTAHYNKRRATITHAGMAAQSAERV